VQWPILPMAIARTARPCEPALAPGDLMVVTPPPAVVEPGMVLVLQSHLSVRPASSRCQDALRDCAPRARHDPTQGFQAATWTSSGTVNFSPMRPTWNRPSATESTYAMA